MPDVAKKFVATHSIFGATTALVGPLGAGKTALVREIAALFGYRDCSSPTFVLSNVYSLNDGAKEIEHWDLYRLKAAPEELYIPPPSYMARFIEWADLFPELMREVNFVIEISYSGDKRRIRWAGNAK